MNGLSIHVTFTGFDDAVMHLRPESRMVRDRPHLWLLYSEQPKYMGHEDAVTFVGILTVPGEVGYQVAPLGRVLVGYDFFAQVSVFWDSLEGVVDYHPALQKIVLGLREAENPFADAPATDMRDIIRRAGDMIYDVVEGLFPEDDGEPAGSSDSLAVSVSLS